MKAFQYKTINANSQIYKRGVNMTLEDKELEQIKRKIVSDIMTANPDTNGEVKVLKSREIEEFVSKNKFVIIDFYATWCPPCKIMDPITRELAETYEGKVAFAKINIQEYQDIAKKYKIEGIPHLILFGYGKKVTAITGLKSVGEIKNVIENIFKKHS